MLTQNLLANHFATAAAYSNTSKKAEGLFPSTSAFFPPLLRLFIFPSHGAKPNRSRTHLLGL